MEEERHDGLYKLHHNKGWYSYLGGEHTPQRFDWREAVKNRVNTPNLATDYIELGLVVPLEML